MSTIEQVIADLQGQATIWAIVACAAIVAVIILVAVMLVKNWLRTKEGKIIDAAKGKRAHLVIGASLGPFAKLMKCTDFNPEGILQTIRFSERWKKRSVPRKVYNPPQKVTVDLEEIKNELGLPKIPTQQEIEAAELTHELIQNELDLNTQKVFLEGCRIPISVACEDKVVWANVKGLGAEAFYNKLEKVQKLGDKIKALQEDADFKDVGDVLGSLYSKISLIDFDFIRSYFGESYTQSNDKSQKEYHYTMGFNDGVESVKGSKDNGKLFLYMGLAGLVVGGVIAAIGVFA